MQRFALILIRESSTRTTYGTSSDSRYEFPPLWGCRGGPGQYVFTVEFRFPLIATNLDIWLAVEWSAEVLRLSYSYN
jgi:hypothetical protein